MRLVLHAVSALALALVAQNNSQFRDWQDTALADNPRLAPKQACAALVAQTGYDFSIVSATTTNRTPAEAPEYCRVVGLIQPEIRFEIDLPSTWNGRIYMFGNGGYAGEALDGAGRQAAATRAVSRGFVAAQTNTGHDGATEPLAAFASSPQKVIDYAFRAVHGTAVTAKTLAQAYYGTPTRRAYFDGCSTGGRQGLIEAQRFPDDFDGIVAGAPVLNFSGTMIGYARDQRALAAAPLSADAIRIVGAAVIAKCDARDGVTDGVIDDPRRCSFTPSRDIPRCGADTAAAGCLTAAQIQAVETLYSPVPRNGSTFFPGWPVGAEAGWIPWFVAPGGGRSISYGFGEAFLKDIAFGRPNPNYDWLTFDVDRDLDRIQPGRTLLDATSPDLSRFKARGGRIVSYVGWADPALNPLMTVGYYESVTKTMGSTADFYRMFMVPGMAHCQGGTGTSTFDAFTPRLREISATVR